jgi:hypothetical protein
MDQFIPPKWKLRMRNSSARSLEEISLQGMEREGGRGKRREVEIHLKRDTRSKSEMPAQDGSRAPAVEEAGTDGGFFEQLWDCLKVVGGRKEKDCRALVVDSRSFVEGGCFPLWEGEAPSLVRVFNLREGSWRGGRRPSLLHIQRKGVMAD